MADSEAPQQGAPQGGDEAGQGFGRGPRRGGGRFGRGRRGDGEFRGRRGDRRGRRGRRGDQEKKDWVPCTKLGRLVQAGKIASLEQIYLFSLSIKESEIIDYFLKDKLKDEVMKIMPVQKQTAAGQRTRFKAFVVVVTRMATWVWARRPRAKSRAPSRAASPTPSSTSSPCAAATGATGWALRTPCPAR